MKKNMKLNLLKKKEIVSKIKNKIDNSVSIVIADFCGINVEKLLRLRKKGRENKVYICVVKNTLARFAIKETKYFFLEKFLLGSTMIAISDRDERSAAHLLNEFSKKNLRFKIKAAGFNGNFVASDKITFLADLPTFKEGVRRIAMVMLESSIYRFIRVLRVLIDKN